MILITLVSNENHLTDQNHSLSELPMSDQNAVVPAPSKGLHIGLWVVQALLAFAFLGAGSMKLFSPAEELIKNCLLYTSPSPRD